jgi:predicted secreted protein
MRYKQETPVSFISKCISCIVSAFVLAGQLHARMPSYSLAEVSGYAHDHHDRQEHRTQVIHVNVGQTFTITLDSNPSTGYTWYLVEPIGEDYLQLLCKSVCPCRCPGGRAKMTFKFSAIQAGQEDIVCEYSRPWSWDIAQRMHYKVIIHELYTHCQEHKPHMPPFMLP